MSLQTRLQDLIVRIATEFKTIRQNFIPYTGATTSVNLNNKNLSNINDFSVNGMTGVFNATTRKFKDVLSYYLLNYPMGSLAIKFPYQPNPVMFDVDIIISQYGVNWNTSGTMKLNVTFYWYLETIHSSGLSVQIESLKTGINKDDYRIRLSKDPDGKPTILIGGEDKQFTTAVSFLVSEVRLRHIGTNDAVFENRINYSIQAGITDITGYSTPVEPPMDSFATKLLTPRKINNVNFDGTADITIVDSTKEPAFAKNTAFNKNFGTVVGTVAQGNDSRIVNGQTAFGWGNHAGLYSSRAVLGTSANSILASDTRSVNPLPTTDLKNGAWFDFKDTGVLGIPSGHTWAGVLTLVPYHDDSGNNKSAFRLAQSNNKLFFQNYITGAWNTWNELWHSGNLTSLSQLTNDSGFVKTSDMTLALATKANDSEVVKLSGDQDINGIKKIIGKLRVPLAIGQDDAVSLGQMNTALTTKEPAFTKNTAFNKNFGTTAGTVAQGNDSRILNGQTAFGWGNFSDYGLGRTNTSIISDADTLSTVSFRATSSSFVGSPFAGTVGGNQGYLNTLSWSDAAFKFQEHIPVNSQIARRYRHKIYGVWTPWVTGIDSNNLDTQATALGFVKTSAMTSALATKADKATTLSGYGITDAEPKFSKNTAFNKNFGTVAGTVAEGNHSHSFSSLSGKPTTLSGYGITDAVTINNENQNIDGNKRFVGILRAPVAIGNDEVVVLGQMNNALATKADKATTLSGYGITDAEPKFSKNTAFNKNFGTTAGTVAQGNDPRFNQVIQLSITTSTNIASDTLISSLSQHGRNVNINNGTNNINYTINSAITSTFMKTGSGSITFIQGSGRTMVQMSGTAIMNGIAGSNAKIVSEGTTDYLYINNY